LNPTQQQQQQQQQQIIICNDEFRIKNTFYQAAKTSNQVKIFKLETILT
jgi:hypothetical protein